MNSERPPLSRGALDRDAATRGDEGLLRAAWQDPAARVLLVRGAEIPVLAGSSAEDGTLALVPSSGELVLADDRGRARTLYLGRTPRGPVFAVLDDADGADAEAGASVAQGSQLPHSTAWIHPFEAGELLDDTERELVSVAAALARWHEAAGFSPRDGGATEPMQAGWARRDAHGAELFPRTDPAVIVLIEHGDRILLGSNALWEAGRFSLLAGFVEAGESLEQAVAREVFEESGVRLGRIEYVTSQPWPFPRSLMLGFRAELADGVDPEALHPDPEEISELRWFTREELRDPDPGLRLPMSLSIARWLIDRWVAGELGGAARGE
ncbi:NAD(+) diphosphatase [Leucobacter luti]|uniref:NAD(+) diphosphatase n=1 Tax=Leucobacter luti TaxID=340320 RepID=UPI003D011758